MRAAGSPCTDDRLRDRDKYEGNDRVMDVSGPVLYARGCPPAFTFLPACLSAFYLNV